MMDPHSPDFLQPERSDEQEELILWLLGELAPDEARRVAAKWRDRPEEVERWRRFLSTTERIGVNLRQHAKEAPLAATPSGEAGGEKRPAARERRAESGGRRRFSPRGFLAKLLVQVPPRVVPVAILSPVVVVFLLWLVRISFAPGSANISLAFVSGLSPTVQVFDQGVVLPSGPASVGAQIRLLGQSPAARFSWLNGRCQVDVSGPAVLLVTEPNLGLLQQEGTAVYDIVAQERPLQLWTSRGSLEVALGRLQLSGTASYLQYEILEGSARLLATGEVLAAGSRGEWGRRPAPEFAALDPAATTSSPGGPVAPEAPKSTIDEARTAGTDQPSTASVEVAAADGNASASTEAADEAERKGTRRLSGRTVRTDNSPVDGVRLTLNLSGGESRETRWRDRLTTTTGPDGLFQFRNLPDAPAAYLQIQHDRLVPEKAYRETRLDKDDETIVLFEPSSISGRLVASEDEAYVGRADIQVLVIWKGDDESRARPLRSHEADRLTVRAEGETFLVSGLAPGNYRLRVETDQGQTGESEDIALGLEEQRRGVEIALLAGGLFSGRVVDGDTLRGIGGAEVRLFAASGRGRGGDWRDGRSRQGGRGEEGDRREKPKAKVVCGERGDFTMAGVTPGLYEVRTSAESYKDNRMTVRVQAGRSHEEVIQLFGEAAAVFGRVVDESGRPIAGALVSAEHSPERLYESKEVATGPDGGYEIPLAPGRWSLRAQAPEDRASWARETVEFERPQRIERNFVLFPGVRVFGSVTRAGQPVGKTRLLFAGESFRHGGGSARTDDAGHYEVVLRPGTYTVFVAEQTRAKIDLHNAAEYPLDIVIADNLINGTITDAETGQPVSGARVILEGDDGETQTPNTSSVMDFFRRSRFERSNRNGFYEYKSVEPGTYRIRATAEGYSETTVSGVVVKDGDDAVLSVPVALSLATALVEVTFKDAETGEPVSGAIAWRVVSLDTGEDILVSARPRTSDSSGFYLITNLRAGTYSMTFMQVSGGGRYLPVTMASARVGDGGEEETSKLEVGFRKGGALRVLARHPAEQDASIFVPLARARVRLIPPPGVSAAELRLEETTNTEGRASFSPLPAGFYSIEVSAPGLPAGFQNSNIQAGETAEVEVTLTPPGARPTPAGAQ